MAYLEINPRYQALLAELRIDSAEALLALPAVAVSGHAERNVSRIRLGNVEGFLKCEHRVRLRDRLNNAIAGYGPSSKSVRETRMLDALRARGLNCPDWIACGQDSHGRALMVVRGLSGFQDVRRFLHEHRELSAEERRQLAVLLGQSLARVHGAGYVHAELLSKHILFHPESQEIYFLDWQRGRRLHFVPWSLRCNDLAVLNASLAEELCTPRERLLCLLAYLRAHARSGAMPPAYPPSAQTIAREIGGRTEALLQKRRVHEQRLPPGPAGSQEIVRLEGEGLCLTRTFWEELHRWSPAELFRLRQRIPARSRFYREILQLPGGRRALLVQSRRPIMLRALWAALRRRRYESPELRLACRLNRPSPSFNRPRLLAYGQRRCGLWHTESFLLTELPAQPGEDRRVA
jgi:tRNA A-37 threonylcarbamoyl transferase component Bud32